MLIIERNSVYEIDEECLKRRKVAETCRTVEKVAEMNARKDEKERERGKR